MPRWVRSGQRCALGGAALLLLALACGGQVEIGAGGGSAGDGAGDGAGGCEPCGRLTPYYDGIPNHCPGEREKWDALLACACRPETCAPDDKEVCKSIPGPMGENSAWICDGGIMTGLCTACVQEHCLEEGTACLLFPKE